MVIKGAKQCVFENHSLLVQNSRIQPPPHTNTHTHTSTCRHTYREAEITRNKGSITYSRPFEMPGQHDIAIISLGRGTSVSVDSPTPAARPIKAEPSQA